MARRAKTFWVYILASGRNGTLYVGVTNDIARRVYQHKEGLVPGFTKKHRVTKLVHCEPFDRISSRRARQSAMARSGGGAAVVSQWLWPLDRRVKPGDDVVRAARPR